jgi:hypothetical protein
MSSDFYLPELVPGQGEVGLLRLSQSTSETPTAPSMVMAPFSAVSMFTESVLQLCLFGTVTVAKPCVNHQSKRQKSNSP